MKLNPILRHPMTRAVLVPLLTAALTLQSATAIAPEWWQARDVLAPGAVADDFAVINQGQLKHIARATVEEMNSRLPGGAGPALASLVGAWNTPTVETDDYVAVTLGQLKHVSSLFYQRLETLRAQIAPNWQAVIPPWEAESPATPPDDYAAANAGQAKHVFAWIEGDRAAHSFSGGGQGGAGGGSQQGGTGSGGSSSGPFRFGLGWFQDSDGDGMLDIYEVMLGSNPDVKDSWSEELGLQVFTPLIGSD